ncbi:MAG: hypothetical protein QM808_04420 [Steroidobacteraceae bacterium]
MKYFRASLRSLSLVLVALGGLLSQQNAVAADAAAQTYYLFVFSNPAAGKEVEFNKWYDEQHAPDVTSVPGFVNGQRFELAPRQLRAVTPELPKYLVVYKIVTKDLAAVYAEVNRRATSGETRMSNTVDMKSFINRTYRTIRPELSGNSSDAGKAAGAKQTYYQFVFGEAASEAQDKEFNDWYDQYHAPEILKVPGFVWGQRMMFSDVQLNSSAAGSKYLMSFRIETNDLNATLDGFSAVAPKMTMSKAFGTALGYTYKAIGPQLDGEKIRASRKK